MARPEICRRIAKYKGIMLILAERYGMDSPQVLRVSLRLDRVLNEEAQLSRPPGTKEGT